MEKIAAIKIDPNLVLQETRVAEEECEWVDEEADDTFIDDDDDCDTMLFDD